MRLVKNAPDNEPSQIWKRERMLVSAEEIQHQNNTEIIRLNDTKSKMDQTIGNIQIRT